MSRECRALPTVIQPGIGIFWKRIIVFILKYRMQIGQSLCRTQEQSTGVSIDALQENKLGHRKAYCFPF